MHPKKKTPFLPIQYRSNNLVFFKNIIITNPGRVLMLLFLQKDVVELIPRVVSKDEYSFMALSIIKRLEAACEAIDLERERDMDFDISTAVQGGVHNSERDEESKDSISTKITSDKIETMISCLETLHLGDEKLLRGNQDAQGGEGEGSEDNHNLGYRSCKVMGGNDFRCFRLN